MIKNPQSFNHQSDHEHESFHGVLSEEASALIGSIYAVYSANIGDTYARFEPAHGSSPKYKGLDKVNPTATILSGAWMLEWIGEKEVGKAIFDATDQVIAEDKTVTYDAKRSSLNR